ncbi:MAG: hydantoinase/oxoprolinase family protein, partial [Gemmatimonadaceae bacterium]
LIGRVVHGTTVATNTLLERSGARVVLCATEGAVDLLELRYQERASLYDLSRHHAAALVPPERCLAVPERIGPRGVMRPLSRQGAIEVARVVRSLEPEMVAISLLHSYRDPTHERFLADAIVEEVGTDRDCVVLSSEVLPEIREYERTATATVEAYLRPVVGRYLRRLRERLAERGFPPPSVMTSSGGMRSADDAALTASSLALSGPAGGVVGAAYVARLAGFSDALTIDIGGTSADAGIVLGGIPLMETGGAVAGVPIALPRVLVETVSAGGGSIGWVDDGGALRVGPRSAGGKPGPAAFARGGTEPTVTDAHVILGNVAGHSMIGGVTLDANAARGAISQVAQRLGSTVDRIAGAMIAAADAAMARALRRVSVERGVDPRRCVLVAFGGGGPLHACALASQLGMRTVLVPPFAGVLSALGLAIAAEQREAIASVMQHAGAMDAGAVSTLCESLAARAGAGERRAWWVRARYAGQGHELEVPMKLGDDGIRVGERFAESHAKRFGFTLSQPIELVSARYVSGGTMHDVRLARGGSMKWNGRIDAGGQLEATVSGPGTIVLPDATLHIAVGWTARSLPLGGWIMERDT